MMFTRYHVAAEVAAGKRVLELGCGSGQGFGLLAGARCLVGGDFSLPLLRSGRTHYGARSEFVRLSADGLPFRSGAFDLVLCFEASYYVPDMSAAFRDIARVLAPAGTILFVNANPERPDFIKSPHSVHYHSADEFRAALEPLGFTVDVAGAFPVDEPARGVVSTIKGKVFSLARTVLETFGLVPKTLRGRARLKRLVYGRLLEVPAELTKDFAMIEPRVPLDRGPVRNFKVIYAAGTRG